MNRTTVAAIAATALVGALGGGVTAIVRGDNTDPDTSALGQGGTATASPSGSSSGAPTGTASVLYAGDHTIHDGKASVRYDAPFDTPDRLVRTPEGYLISHDLSPQEPSSRVYYVTASGATSVVADILGRFDLDESGKRIVAEDLESGKVKVWGLDGKVQAAWSGPTLANRPVWSGDTVLASVIEGGGAGESGEWRMYSWDPAGDTLKKLDTVGMAEMNATRDGRLLSAAVGLEGSSVVEENYCMAVATAPGQPGRVAWDTCDWRANGGHSETFSPSGKLVLAVPSETDGFGPGLFATFSATEGPSGGLEKFDAPEWTMDATWLDDDTLVLVGATDGDLDANTGTWIRTCTRAGTCTAVATRTHGDLVVGEQG